MELVVELSELKSLQSMVVADFWVESSSGHEKSHASLKDNKIINKSDQFGGGGGRHM